MVLRIGNDAVVLLAAGIALELVQRKHLRELLRLKIDASEIAHGGCAGYIETGADLPGRRNSFKGTDDLGYQPAGDTVIAGQECVTLKETLAAVASIAALTKVQEGISCQRNILDHLHPIVVYTVCDRATGRASMLFSGKLHMDVKTLRTILHICDNYIFQIQNFCCIILIEHRDTSFVVIDATFMIKDFPSMLNL